MKSNKGDSHFREIAYCPYTQVEAKVRVMFVESLEQLIKHQM